MCPDITTPAKYSFALPANEPNRLLHLFLPILFLPILFLPTKVIMPLCPFTQDTINTVLPSRELLSVSIFL